MIQSKKKEIITEIVETAKNYFEDVGCIPSNSLRQAGKIGVAVERNLDTFETAVREECRHLLRTTIPEYSERDILLMDNEHRLLAKQHNKKLNYLLDSLKAKKDKQGKL